MAVVTLRRLLAASAWLPAVSAGLQREQPYPWAPVQTPAPRPEAENLVAAAAVTALPVMRGMPWKRQSGPANTCGFVDGDAASGYICAHSEAVCLRNTVASAVGCCLPTGCGIYTACLDYTASDATSTLNMDRTRYCSNSKFPSCAALVYDGPMSGYTIPTCDTVATTSRIYVTPLDRPTRTTSSSSSSETETDSETSSETESSSTSTDTDDATKTQDSAQDTATSIPDTDDKNDDDNNDDNKTDDDKDRDKEDDGGVVLESPTPVGPIVGGVVGGVAGLALIGLGIFFLLRRKSSSANSMPSPPAGPPAQPSYMQQSPSPGPNPPPGNPGAPAPYGPPPPGDFDPRYSTAKPPMAGSPVHHPMVPHMPPPGSPVSVAPSNSPPPPMFHNPVPPMHAQPPHGAPPPGGYVPYTGNTHGAPPPGGYVPYPGNTHGAVELPTQKGDGQLYEAP